MGELSVLNLWIFCFWHLERISDHASIKLFCCFSKPDCSGVIHVATDTSVSQDQKAVVKNFVSMNDAVLSSVKESPWVKSFVLTSSRIAICNPKGGSEYRACSNKDWYDEALGLAEKITDDKVKPLFICE